MITVENLSKYYHKKCALDNVSFTIPNGEIVGFLGPNGAGKTTTMKLLTCFMPPSSGKATINGFSIHENADEIKQLIGYLPENNPLYLEMTVYNYLSFIADIRQLPKAQKANRIDWVIQRCKLNEYVYKPIHTLSKGYRQRVGLAQSLIHEPSILILDEPTNGLDPHQIIEIRHLIKELGKERTVILCSHILPEVAQTCSRVFILNQGKIVANDSPQALQENTLGSKKIDIEINQPSPAIESHLKAIPELDHVQCLKTDKNYSTFQCKTSTDIREKMFDLAVKNNWKIRHLSIEETSLESIFLSLTKEKP